MNNLVFHYQTVIHRLKDSLYLHEAFSTRTGELYSVNPISVEVSGGSEAEVEETLKAMETDSTRYKPVRIEKIQREMLRWSDEVPTATPAYEDEEDLEEDYYGTDGEVLDLCEYIERNK